MIGIRGWRSRAFCGAAVLALTALACGNEEDAPPPESVIPEVQRFEMNGFVVPVRENDDPTLVDSCLLLTSSDPKGMIQEPLAPLMRMTDVCLAFAESTPQLDHSLTVELRYPGPVEIEEQGGVPTNLDQFWIAEGSSVGLMGGVQKEIQQLEGIGDFAIWYPISGGMSLHAYWQGKYILAIYVRGFDPQVGLTWSKEVAAKAIHATTELEAKSAKQG